MAEAVLARRETSLTPELDRKVETIVADEVIPLSNPDEVRAFLVAGNKVTRSSIGDMRRAGCTRAQVRLLLEYAGVAEPTARKILNDLDSYGEWEGDAR